MHTVRVCDKRTGKLRAILLPLIEPNQPGNPLLAAQIMRRYCRVSFDVRKQYLLRPVPPPSHKGWQPQQYEPVECWVQGGWWSGWIERDEGSAKRIRLPDLCATLLASSTEQLRPAYVWHGPEAGFKRARAVLKSVSEAIVSAPALSMQDHASRKRKPRGVDFGGMPIGSNENTSRKTYEVSFDDFWASSIRGAESILSEPPKGCDSSHAKKLPTDSMSSDLLRSEAASYVAERWEQLRYEVPEHKRERYTEYEQLKGHDVMLAEQALYEVVHRNKVTLSAASVSASSVFDDALAYIRSRSTRGSAASHSGGRRLQSPSIGQARPTPRPAVSAEQLTASSYALCKPKLEYRQQHAWPLCIEFTEACEAQGRRWCYMLLGMRDGCVHAWSLEAPNLTLQYLNFFKAHSDSPVMAMSRVRNSSSMVVTGSAAGEVRLWQLNGFNPDTVPSATRVETPVPLQQQSEQERQRLDLPSPSESLPLSPVTALTALYSISASLIAVGIGTSNGCITVWTSSGNASCRPRYENCMGVAFVAPEARLHRRKPLAVIASYASGSVEELLFPLSGSRSLVALREPLYTVDKGPTAPVIGSIGVCDSPNDGLLVAVGAVVHESSRQNLFEQRSVARVLVPSTAKKLALDTLSLSIRDRGFAFPLADVAMALQHNCDDTAIRRDDGETDQEMNEDEMQQLPPLASQVQKAVQQPSGCNYTRSPLHMPVWQCNCCGAEKAQVESFVPVCPRCKVLAEYVTPYRHLQ